MKRTDITLGILFGGQSAEHEVSLKSAEALYNNLDIEKFTPFFIFISRKEGRWHIVDETAFKKKEFLLKSPAGYSFLPWFNHKEIKQMDADIYFPMLHGPMGEDGKIQSLLELAGKPYVGAGSLASNLAMDKVVSKKLFQQAGLSVGKYLVFRNTDFQSIKEAITGELSYPVFIKPSAMGSSVGISKVQEESQLDSALDLAFRYDKKVLAEEALDVREIEVSVMGNDEIMISRPGELIPHNEFYDYEDKYLEGKTTFHIPAQLDAELEERVRQTAGEAFKALFLNGMARMDLFVEKKTGNIYINEANTIPGFTEISMFPKLWTLQGIPFSELITRLIEYGFQYHREQKISTDRS